MKLKLVSKARCFGGWQGIYQHPSHSTSTNMTFAVYVPPLRHRCSLPVLWFLPGINCTYGDAIQKAHYHRTCSELGLILVVPDTSPRGSSVPDAHEDYVGQGAGFYLNALEPPWQHNFQMESYILHELPKVISTSFNADMSRQGVFGHSMGGHGALMLALKAPHRFRSVSALAPIASVTRSSWGQKALTEYLGQRSDAWRQNDVTSLIEDGARLEDILVDQGTEDPYLTTQLNPGLLEIACRKARIPLYLRRQSGYDHSYYFVSSFMEEHLRWHASRLGA